jgi:diketogulonate reductase-like aldo/keto reductase
VDMFLIHNPNGKNVLQTWGEMIELKKEGFTKAIGVSNFGVEQIQGIIDAGYEVPELNQVELHVFLPQRELVALHQKHHILTMGFAPLARCKRFGVDGPLLQISKRRGVTESLVMLSWSVQSEVITIPKSTNQKRIVENFKCVQFRLSEDEMAELATVADGFKSSKAVDAMDTPWEVVK